MTDKTQNAAATPDQPVEVVVATASDDPGVEAVAGIGSRATRR